MNCEKCKGEIKQNQYYHHLYPTSAVICEKCYADHGDRWIMNWALLKNHGLINIKRDKK